VWTGVAWQSLVGPQGDVGPQGEPNITLSGLSGLLVLTQAEYDALTPDADIVYLIRETGTSQAITAIVALTQAEYDALGAPDATTLYLVQP
jgi:hypothetical protein